MPKITPFLWFDQQVEEAVNFPVSIFRNSMIKPDICALQLAGARRSERATSTGSEP